MSELWFKRKTYGWGWTPCNYKGWLAILTFAVTVFIYPALCKLGYFSFDVVVFFVSTLLFSGILIFICHKKGEKPAWQWGKKE